MSDDAEYLFLCFLFGEMSIQIFYSVFLMGLFVSLLLNLESSWYFLEISHLFNLCFADIFSKSVSCIFSSSHQEVFLKLFILYWSIAY